MADQLFVTIGKNQCLAKGHFQKDRIVLAQFSDQQYHQIAVTRCVDCSHYTIDMDSFCILVSRFGAPFVQIVYIENGIIQQDMNGRLFISDYRKYGYTVSQDVGLSDKQRHEILRNLIETGIKTKEETKRFLSTLISINGKKRGNYLAMQKWKRDLEYIESLDL